MTLRLRRRTLSIGCGLGGTLVLGQVATQRGESINAAWVLLATICFYLLAYRFYGRFIADNVLGLDDARATPAEVHDDGTDFVPSHKWVVFGHHFAAVAGPGPLIGPVLAAQLGYLPGLLWLPIGAVFGGAVQDLVVLFCSMRRDGRSLGRMARDELGPLVGFVAILGILVIMIILLAVVALVVVRALAESPWGTSTIAATIPIALAMGCYLRWWRPGRVEEASLLGFVLVLAALWGGGAIAQHATLGRMFTLSGTTLAWLLIIYGFAASTVPVWLLLAPRDYLSTFVKIGTVLTLALGILLVRPSLQMPALTQFVAGNGPVWPGSVFPFFFLTIACGAISGFHSLIASGTTPKLIAKESHARLVGYGGMLTESFVGLMALLAACVLSPGIYFAINTPARLAGPTPQAAVTSISSWGFAVSTDDMDRLTVQMGEQTLYHRTGGAPTLAVGMASILGALTGGRWLALWYHFAIMFEALFILTTLDAGTRVGRFMLQDLLGQFHEPLGRVSWWPSIFLSSGLIVGAWGWLLYAGVIDPLGGINSLWHLFGIANQMLATIALCVATTILMRSGRARFAWVAGVPMAWLFAVTQTASWQKIFSPQPSLGFLAAAAALRQQTAGADTQHMIQNDYLCAGLAAFLALCACVVLAAAVLEWWRVWRGRGTASEEAAYVASRLSA
jgi:carbon starvation protein